MKIKANTGEVHEVQKYIKGYDNLEHIWCNTWYGHHIISQDCEWDESLLTDEQLQTEAEAFVLKMWPDKENAECKRYRRWCSQSWVAGASQYAGRVRELEQALKELDHSFDYLVKMDGVKDAGHRWIEFSDKWRAFKKALLDTNKPSLSK